MKSNEKIIGKMVFFQIGICMTDILESVIDVCLVPFRRILGSFTATKSEICLRIASFRTNTKYI